MFKYHVFALLLGTILEFFLGNLPGIYNPFDSLKRWIKYLDRALLGDELILLEKDKQKTMGVWLLILAIFPPFVLVLFFDLFCWDVSYVLGIIFEVIVTYYCISSRKLYYGIIDLLNYYFDFGLEGASSAYSTLTDTEKSFSNEKDMIATSIFTFAKMAGDYVICPLFVMFLFGPVGGVLYKTIDMIDSRVGHRDARYQYFGYYPSRINDVVNLIPSRFAARVTLLYISLPFGNFNKKNAKFIYYRDAVKKGQLNSYQMPSVYAGALGVFLPNVEIGDSDKDLNFSDIRSTANLMQYTYMICQLILLVLLIVF